jgi:hypothetical protein
MSDHSNYGILHQPRSRHVIISLTLRETVLKFLASLPPTELEPTAAEIVAAYQAQNKRTERLQNAPLITQQMRDRQQEAKIKKWPNVSADHHASTLLNKSCWDLYSVLFEFAFITRCSLRNLSRQRARLKLSTPLFVNA